MRGVTFKADAAGSYIVDEGLDVAYRTIRDVAAALGMSAARARIENEPTRRPTAEMPPTVPVVMTAWKLDPVA